MSGKGGACFRGEMASLFFGKLAAGIPVFAEGVGRVKECGALFSLPGFFPRQQDSLLGK